VLETYKSAFKFPGYTSYTCTRPITNNMVLLIGTLSFPSAAAAKQYTRAIIAAFCTAGSTRHRNADAFNFLSALLQRHPSLEKSHNVIDIEIVADPYAHGKLNMLQAVREDGSKETFSWHKCVDAKQETSVHALNRALRYSVTDQILAFGARSSECISCSLCGTKSDKFHIDHVVPFATLVDTFTKDRSDLPCTFGRDEDKKQPIFCASDALFAEEWRAFHRHNAVLRTLCVQCNLRREKPQISGHKRKRA